MNPDKSLADIVEEQIASGKVVLPVFDQTAVRIRQMIERGVYDPEAVEKLVGSDPALSGTLLRHANSSFFGGIEKVVTVRDAIMRLGVKQVSELVILSTQRQQYQLNDPKLREFADKLWQHAVGCGVGSEWLARKLRMQDREQEAFMAGLLHDIGKLLLLRVLDDLIEQKALAFQPSGDLVLELLASLHCAHGHRLMQTWNIPDVYANVVKNHHDEDYEESDRLLGLIRLVDMACNRLGIGIRGEIDLNLAACPEAQRLRASEVALAELEVRIEDAMHLSG
ncbi:MAG: HDOD domain-containing protein [Myxococcota bacterium]